ncbi:MAG: DUF4326 domain-containing protein [Acidimicrobiales bacterium]
MTEPIRVELSIDLDSYLARHSQTGEDTWIGERVTLEDVIYVGRPTRWGNIFVAGQGQVSAAGTQHGTAAGRYSPREPRRYNLPLRWGLTAAEASSSTVRTWKGRWPTPTPHYDELRAAVAALAGYRLACWCKLSQPCHADVLLVAANPTTARYPGIG